MRNRIKLLPIAAAAGVLTITAATGAAAEAYKLRLGSGHPPGQHYVDLLHSFFVPQVKERVAARTSHTVDILEAYSGSVVKVSETLVGVQNGIVDIGGMCYCFEPSRLQLHVFQAWAPFGTPDAATSLAIVHDMYNEMPELSGTFEAKYDQKVIALIGQNNYDIISKTPLEGLGSLRGMKIGGAGANLPWVGLAGAVPVQTSGPIMYTSLQTGVYDGAIIHVSLADGLKLYEVAKNYAKVGFGSIAWHGLQINLDTWNRLPKEVRDIIAEVGMEYEAKTGTYVNEFEVNGFKRLEGLGVKIAAVDAAEKAKWAAMLKDWPNEKAKEADKDGLPGTRTVNLLLSTAEKHGYKWPVRYEVTGK
ncbi:MAG: C4-dicarboxylate TRAP transporter substrate-binding protein [Alphaproteobacteria bacterium]